MVARALRGRLGAALLASLLAASVAAASPREEIGQYTLRAAELEKLVEGDAIADEVGTLRAWIAEAQGLLDAGEADAVARSLDRVRAQAALVEALVDRRRADVAERAARNEADGAERDVQAIRRKAEERERMLRQLELQEAPVAPGTTP